MPRTSPGDCLVLVSTESLFTGRGPVQERDDVDRVPDRYRDVDSIEPFLETIPDPPPETIPDAPLETIPDAPPGTIPDPPPETIPEAPPGIDSLQEPNRSIKPRYFQFLYSSCIKIDI